MAKFDDNVSPSKIPKFDLSSDDEDENLTYEQLREKRMKENMQMFDLLGVNQAAETLANSIKKTIPLKKKSTQLKRTLSKRGTMSPVSTPTRRSSRIALLSSPQAYTEEELNNFNSTFQETTNNYADIDKNDSESNTVDPSIPVLMPEKDFDFFEKLSADLVVKEAVNDFHTCDFDRFTTVLKSLEMNEPGLKVIKSRIYALAIHPSETSLIIAAGDMKGNIAIYNKNESDMREYKVHNCPVNCVSFCSWDPCKLFSTSHDGTVRCGDISKHTFDIIYTTELWAENSYKDSHATWHTEYERNNLLIGSGAGRVDLIDLRTPKKINDTAWCHQRSVRTVQCHPIEKHYFLTSSGVGEASLWDVRNMTSKKINPVLQFEHSKALTSAFFSASGSKIVTTSNDNYLRIFNTSKLDIDSTKPTHKIKHDNHTGRWLSVFKAKWHPGRDDAFFVGSMLLPKSLQIYQSNGNLLHALHSEHMTTYCPVIEAHPTQAIYVGGNSSGRLHIFTTEQQL